MRQAVESCLGQTYKNLELIIIIDGSTDSSVDILETFVDERIKIFKHETNLNLPRSLNDGFERATGKIFTWIADDDLFTEDAIEKLVDYLIKKPEIDAVYSDYGVMNEDGQLIKRVPMNSLEKIREKSITTPCFMYRSHVFNKLGGFNTELFMIEDYDFFIRTWQNFSIGYLQDPQILYFLRDRGGSLTGRYRWKVQRMSIELRRKLFHLSWIEVQQQISEIEVHQAFENYRAGNRLETVKKVSAAVVRNPLWLKNRGLISIFVRSILPSLTFARKP